ncbi:hypothetical protein ACPOM7_03580 [Peribacillus castrilensis]|uniref:MFS transporter n=1 Tax=Peribacillus TaxID=2675229 RepID=UPI000ABB44F9|nr:MULTISPECIES: MFS transporter [Peribacillus]MCT1389086.1 hypothetical protein [Peribacillus frigoritolerans]
MYVEQNLQLGEEWWGYINTCYFVGMIFSGLIVIRFAKLLEKYNGFFIIFGLFLSSLLIQFFGTTSIPALALLLACLYGLPEQILYQAIPRPCYGKDSCKNSCRLGSSHQYYICRSVLLLGFITETYSVKTTFQFSSTLIFLAFLYATFKRNDLIGKQCDQSLSSKSSNLPR